MTYKQKLLDPRWQKRRLEIMNRDGFSCKGCFTTNSTLFVHHRYYLPDTEPWDYDDKALITLCEYCHQYEHETRPIVEATLLKACKQAGLECQDLQLLSQAIMNASAAGNTDQILFALKPFFASEQEWSRHSDPTPQPIKGLK